MLTPQEISERELVKAVFGGYDMAPVDSFIEAVAKDYADLYKENAVLKNKMKVLVDKIEEYRAVDEELRKTLYNAQITAKDTISRAQSDAERILRDARTAANQSVADLQSQVVAEELRLEEAKRNSAAYAEKIRKAMELGIRQMEDVLSAAAPAPKAAEPQPAPAAPVGQHTAIFETVVQAVEAEPVWEMPAPVEEPAEEPAQEEAVSLDLEVESEDPAVKTDPQSDTGRIYGDSPFTPKPRFNFNDMRFGKQYDADNDNE